MVSKKKREEKEERAVVKKKRQEEKRRGGREGAVKGERGMGARDIYTGADGRPVTGAVDGVLAVFEVLRRGSKEGHGESAGATECKQSDKQREVR